MGLCHEAKWWGLLCRSREGSGANTEAEPASVFSPAEQTWGTAGWGTMHFLMAENRKFITVFWDPCLGLAVSLMACP